MKQPLLQMKNMTKAFSGNKVLKGVDLQAYSGQALALIGANGAGKSTLMNILGGVVPADGGEILIDGVPASITNPREASHFGVSFVHQEMALLPTMTVAENMSISDFPLCNNRLIDVKQNHERCRETLERMGSDIDPNARLSDLRAGERQIVEIARALLGDAKILILDEPTSSLSSREKNQLFKIIRSLKEDGVAIIYITHLMDEVFEICDRATVLRDGRIAGSGLIEDFTSKKIVSLMIGEELKPDSKTHLLSESHVPVGEPILKAQGLGQRGNLHDISFSLCKGEILGIWGLLGSGRTELARACAGLDPIDSGQILLTKDGVTEQATPRDLSRAIGLITENRRDDGLFLPLSARFNMSLPNMSELARKRWPFIDRMMEIDTTRDKVQDLSIAISSIEQPVGTLSGGNQQKVILGRWLEKQPDIYIMDEPTRGIDVATKAEVRRIIRQLVREGAAVILISSDIDELMSLSDRYLVMDRGRVVAEYSKEATKSDLMLAAAGGMQEGGKA